MCEKYNISPQRMVFLALFTSLALAIPLSSHSQDIKPVLSARQSVDVGLCDSKALSHFYSAALRSDQNLRQQYLALISEGRGNAQDLAQLESKIIDDDALNQIGLELRVTKCGWPAAVGPFQDSDVEAAFLIVQHAPLDFQRKYKDFLVRARDRGDIPAHIFSLFATRLAKAEREAEILPDGSSPTSP